MDYIIFALVGLVVGAIAKFIVPGKQGGGIIITAILGMLGSVLGQFGARALGIVSQGTLMNWIISIIGAVIVVWIYSLITKKSSST